MPMRLDYEVRTAGPRSKLSVPTDAVLWNADKDRWDRVGSGVQATSRIVYDYSRYFSSKWHHGLYL